MKLGFYLKYIARLFMAERALTIMTILSIAVGVGVLGAVETLGKGVQEMLVKDVRQNVGGDLVARAFKRPFIQADLRDLTGLRAKGTIAAFAPEAVYQETIGAKTGAGLTNFWFISADHPLYGPKLRAKEPAGAPVSKLLKKGIVISDYAATKLKIGPGDKIRLGLEPGRFKVAGVIGDEANPSLDMRVIGFVIRPIDQLKAAIKYTPEDHQTAANMIFIKTNQPTDAARAKEAIEKIAPAFSTVETADGRAREYAKTTETIKTGDSAFGFLSLLIIGIGVGHAVRLWARRRLADVAVFKALGLKTREVKILFLLALGVFSVIGGLFGLSLSLGFVWFLKEFARRFIGVPGSFYWFYPQELALVVVSTFLVVTAFSLNSITALSRALPASTLRAGAGDFPAPGWLRQISGTLASTLLLIGAATLVVGDTAVAAQVVVGALISGAAILLLYRLFFKALPAGLPLGASYKLAVRSIKSQMSTATHTALVILVGVAALSLVIILSESVKSSLAVEIAKQTGHDAIVVVPPDAPAGAKDIIKKTPGGLKRLSEGQITPVDLVSINHNQKLLKQRLEAALDSKSGNADPFIFQFINRVSLFDPSTYRPWRSVEKGRNLRGSDKSRRVVVVSGRVAKRLKLELGDTLELRAGGRATSLKVIGQTEFSQISTSEDLIAPFGALAGAPKAAISYYLTFKGDKKTAVRWLNQHLKKTIVLDISEISDGFAEVIDAIRVFPLLVSLLALTAAVVVIASGVSIGLIERRRELATLKALGARSGRILGLLAYEHIIVGLAGGLSAVVVVAALARLLTQAMFKTAGPINYLAVAVVVDIAVGLALISGLIPALRAARARPLEVLRGE